MSAISLHFHACRIKTEGVATEDEGDYFDGAVDFDVVIGGRVHRGLSARVKQAAGSSFACPLEVEWPERFGGGMPYGAYRDCVDRYVRRQVARAVLRGRRRNGAIRVAHLRLSGEAVCMLVSGSESGPSRPVSGSIRMFDRWSLPTRSTTVSSDSSPTAATTSLATVRASRYLPGATRRREFQPTAPHSEAPRAWASRSCDGTPWTS